MRRVYLILLRMYPADFRAVFEAEMLRVFESTLESRRAEGRGLRFIFSEAGGLLGGAAREWSAKLTTDRSVRRRAFDNLANPPWCLPPKDVPEAERRVNFLVNRIVYAIAHHDFPGARDYSYQEQRERENLKRLRKKYEAT